MVQCSVCFKIFASKRYLTSHLQQSRNCLNAFTTGGIVSSRSTSEGTIIPSEIVNADIVQRPLTFTASGDIIVADEDDSNSTGSFPSPELDESSVAVADPLADNREAALAMPLQGAGQPSSILLQESFNVPAAKDDKLIFMLKLITAVRASGAPLNLVDVIVKIIMDEWKVGRLDITNLCSHRTAMRRISQMFPSLATPISVTISHERTPDELNSGAERPSLTFPKFPFLGQLQDLLDDHVFSDLQNLVLDPDDRWS